MNLRNVTRAILTSILLMSVSSCNTDRAVGFTGSWDRGLPVWADDGSSIAGIETRVDDGIIFPPLQGWTGKVNPRFVLHTQAENGSPRALNGREIKGYALSMTYMKTAGYITVTHLKQPEELRSVIVFDLNGNERGRLSNVDLDNDRGPIIGLPSNDGRVIAVATWDIDYNTYQDGTYQVAYEIVFLDAETAEPISSQTFSTSIDGQHPKFTWNDDETLTVSDMSSMSARVGLTGTVELGEALNCLPNPVSSRIRSSDGATLSRGTDRINVDYSADLPADMCR